MPVLDHAKRFQTALRLFCRHAERRKRVGTRLKHDVVVIHDQNVNGFKLHIFTLPVGNGDIQNDREGRSLALLALTVNRSAEQIDHLFCNREAQPGPLNAVDTAVNLTGEGLIHGCHEFRRHPDPRIRNHIGQPNAAGRGALFLTQVHADTAARFRVFDGVGENVDINLIQTKLVRIEVFLFHLVDVEAEINILLLDHRL